MIFDFVKFLRAIQNPETANLLNESKKAKQAAAVVCTRIVGLMNSPSTRWGHASVCLDDRMLLIFGGRNDNDVNDIHCFDLKKYCWKEIKLAGPRPVARRRLTCIKLGQSSLVLFGGFNGHYFNDLYALDFTKHVFGARSSGDKLK